jgi:hypothetical protein
MRVPTSKQDVPTQAASAADRVLQHACHCG